MRGDGKDAAWALDFFAVKTAKGVWLQALFSIDVYTRELIDLRVYDGWDVDSVWTIRAFNEACGREKRQPKAVVHDHGTHFAGQFDRQMRVLEIENEVTPVYVPQMNGVAEPCEACEDLRRARRHTRGTVRILESVPAADIQPARFAMRTFSRDDASTANVSRGALTESDF